MSNVIYILPYIFQFLNMSELTTGLLIFALVLLSITVVVGLKYGDFTGLDYLASFKDGFTPMSNDYSGGSQVFQPEGYGTLGTYIDTNNAPNVMRQINMGGLSYVNLRKKYPAKHDYQFIT
jgi:hypothetical protein